MTKLIILHGNGLVSKSNKLSQIKKDFDNLGIKQFNGEEVDFEKIIAEISTPSLFSQERLIVLENFDEKIDLKKIPSDETLTVVIKFPKALNKLSSTLKEAQNLNAQIYLLTEQEENSIFPFLDTLADKNPKALSQLDKLLEDFGGQYILTMIFYMFRRLIVSSKKLPEFVIRKIESQKRNFTLEKIESLYKSALETDFKIKSGLIEEKMGLTMLCNKVLS